jgi:hypothetical protein
LSYKSNELLVEKGLFDIIGAWFIGIHVVIFANLVYLSKSVQLDTEFEYK